MRKTCPASLRSSFLTFLCLVPLFTSAGLSQQDEGVHIFGTIQPIFFVQDWHLTGVGIPQSARDFSRNTFALQQMDLFLSKQIDNEFDVFVDMEFQLNYSTQNRWGDFSIQEAWLNYGFSNQLNVKAGLLYPAFNNLNEIKNRLGILPYIFRPIIYERLLEFVFSPEQFIPERAFLQAYGTIPTHNFLVDYAVYMGNAERSYISRKDFRGNPYNDLTPQSEFLTGVDPTGWKLKLYGGRIGIRSRDEQTFKAGISVTHDYHSLRDSIIPSPLQGDARRLRFGLDASGACAGFEAQVEYIHAFYDFDPFERAGIHLENSFFSGTVGYNILESLYGYVSYQHGFEREGSRLLFDCEFVGLMYRVNNSVSAKAQFISYLQKQSFDGNEPWAAEPFTSRLRINFFMVGCSVLF